MNFSATFTYCSLSYFLCINTNVYEYDMIRNAVLEQIITLSAMLIYSAGGKLKSFDSHVVDQLNSESHSGNFGSEL